MVMLLKLILPAILFTETNYDHEYFRTVCSFIGVDLTLANNMSVKLEIKKDRNISLSLANNQITEIKGSEVKFGSGYIGENYLFLLKLLVKL